ncbi:hypothetical protein DIPPA_06267 [Diplonema papillatum]|nr:hypothetical protein DIPPA_06267 [Diplonema papillatum]
MINVRVAQKRMRNHLELTLEETAKNAQHPKPGAGGNALGGKALEKREIKKINGVTLKQKAHGSTHSSKNGFKAPKRAKDVTPKQTNSPQHIPLQHTPDPESDRSHKSVHESLDQTHKTHGSSPPPKLDSFHSRPMSPANSIHEATVTSVHALSPSQQSQNYRQQQLQQQQHQQQQQKQSANGDATLKSDPMSSTHFQKGNKMGQTHGSTPYNPYQTVSTDPQDATLNQGSDLHFSHGSNLNDASLIGTRIGSNSNSNNSNTNHMNNNNNNNNHGNNNNNNDKKNTPSSQQPLPARTTPQAHPVTNTRSPQNPPKKVSDNKDGGCSCAVM